MPKAKPISLHPLGFHDALKALVNVDPEKVGISSAHRKKHARRKKRQEQQIRKT